MTSSGTARVVVVGASLGGLRVAEALRGAGFGGELVVVGDEPHLPYNRPPLSKEALAGGVSLEALLFRRRRSLDDVRWLLGSPATSCDLAARRVRLADGTQLDYDGLAIATGVRPRRLTAAAGPGSRRHAVRTLEDARALREQLRPGARVVILGAGFVGCEVAATARELGCTVDVVAPERVPMQRPLGGLVGAGLQRRHERHGVRFHLGRLPAPISPDPAGTVARDAAAAGPAIPDTVILDDGSELPADVVIEALGCIPNVEWLAAQDGGPGLDLTDGVRTDGLLRAVRTDGAVLLQVVAVGDIARFPNPRYDDVPRRVEHWSLPTDTGRRAGATLAAQLAGREPGGGPFAPLPSFWSDQYGARLQSFGALGLADQVVLLDGDPDGPFVAEYRRAGQRVGVLGLDSMPALLQLRTALLPYP